jgi:hypothetical protein
MNGRIAAATVFGLILGLAIALFVGQRQVQAQQQKEQRWEYKVVALPLDSNKATDQMNALARDGWEYVGLINTSTSSISSQALKDATGQVEKPGHESSVAFRRAQR